MGKINNKKIFVLLPDGIGLKNFAYSSFPELGSKNGFDIVYWNKTSFDLGKIGFSEVKLPNSKPHFLSTILKNVKNTIFLDYFTSKFDDDTYQSYKFKSSSFFRSWTESLKEVLYRIFLFFFKIAPKESIQSYIHFFERRTSYYRSCKSQLTVHKPDFIFCTNQRHISAIAPILAASDLGIPTSTFIFSWDNLPKATLVVSTDFFYVWSSHMKNELLRYYSNVKEEQIKIVGTPQFEFHYNSDYIISKDEFFGRYNLNEDWDYICFSGDDITTSPFDEYYLRDLASSISQLNQNHEKKLGIIFRRCPVDFSDRYDPIIAEFEDIIIPINPLWKSFGQSWNEIMPTAEDIKILNSTIFYSKAVFNLGSSMVFDFIIFDKPCFYFNYDPVIQSDINWSVQKIYKFIHFKSMPSENAVMWIMGKDDLRPMLLKVVDSSQEIDLNETRVWFNKIVSVSPNTTSSAILNSIKEIV
ncbi:MAG: UDP-glycosyltransferase [Algoriphagus sp.]|uniref:hypothetical protein n=1 Tax=Algoriphagus sp. TaxID=1872435 RepID=UPI001834F3CC|nr:hypothetical protein [Algoriphagus sp.]NVJ86765.1 UDP-glycosyltransferase [Algoriphagus sp.]